MLESASPVPVAPASREALPHLDDAHSVTSATSPGGKPLAALLEHAGDREILGEATRQIHEVAYRSDEVRPGSLFFCVPGTRTDGHRFAADAVAAGAVALVCERPLPLPVTRVVVPSVRRTMGPISAELYGRPSDDLTMVGVTGTNGKTTTTYLLESVLAHAGLEPGVVGTTGVRVAGVPRPFARTTPEAPDLQRLLAEMTEAGVRAVAIEVSSHGLDQHRVDGIRFECAVFTNLSQDHLDYHPSMEEYFLAKARLFTPEMSSSAAVNLDDPYGRRLLDRGVRTVTYGIESEADVRADSIETTSQGLSFRVGAETFRSRLRGQFNVYNCLSVVAAGRALGIDPAAVAAGIESLPGVPGRLESVEQGQDFLVVVDYAHTPDSLENVLRAARPLAERRVIVVFGCGGDRDRTKRAPMGEVATRSADLAVLTSDNPRSEDPHAIIAEVEVGARSGGGAYVVEPDRRAAIRAALAQARGGDVVVVAGKGHETGQEFATHTIPFDDREVVAEELRRLPEGRS